MSSRLKAVRERAAGPVDASGGRPARQSDWPCPIPLQIKTKVWLQRDGAFVIGDGGLRLLAAIEMLGSLLAAARQIGWSYRHAWHYLRQGEHVLGAPLVVPKPGKGGRRGTVLTPQGRYLMRLLGEITNRVDRTANGSGPIGEEIPVRGRRLGTSNTGRRSTPAGKKIHARRRSGP